MGSNSNQNKKNQLGMPFGTAMHRLRKSITFHLLQKLGEDICYVCKTRIKTVEELSIEHKLPWQGNDTNLFWEIENIAFSHLRCNTSHVNGAYQLRRTGPEGTAWCHNCKTFKDRSLFHKRKKRWNGLRDICKGCEVPQIRRRAQEKREI